MTKRENITIHEYRRLGLDCDGYRPAWASGTGHLSDHLAEDEPGRQGVPTVEEPQRWRQRYESTLRRLRDFGVRLPTDREAGWREYRYRRHAWELELAAFALYLGYDWEEVSGDGDLRLALE